jgi:hypothetical protein
MADIVQFQHALADLLLVSAALATVQQTIEEEEGGIINILDAACCFVLPSRQDRLDDLTEEGIPLFVRRVAPY